MSIRKARLEDKVAIVLGAGTGGEGMSNGRATAVVFAREGAKVLAVDVNAESASETVQTIRSEGGAGESMKADVTKVEDLRKVVQTCMDRFGRIDVLQCNVGYCLLGGPVELDAALWQAQMDINVNYVFNICKLVLPIMEKQGRGSIVTVSSIAGLQYLGVDFIGYATSKAALQHFTRSVAMQYAKKGIRANVVVPGKMDTPAARGQLGTLFADVDHLISQRDASCPSGKQGEPWDIAYASLFLASDEAKYVNGVILPVDGGLTFCS